MSDYAELIEKRRESHRKIRQLMQEINYALDDLRGVPVRVSNALDAECTVQRFLVERIRSTEQQQLVDSCNACMSRDDSPCNRPYNPECPGRP